jgi:eukaryotic-like serine/threonine-protein kinase
MTSSVNVSIGQCSMVGPKESNDDCFGVAVPPSPQLEIKGIAMAIADGMSSSEGAKIASQTCIRTFLEDYYATHSSWTVKTSVGRVMNATNRWLFSQGESRFRTEQAMVATFSGLIMKAGVGYVFHVGDSQIALLRGDDWQPLTSPHRAVSGPGRDSLVRAVGMSPDLAVDYREVPLLEGDVLVFTTDGVHDSLPASELVLKVQLLKQDLNGAATQICKAALLAGSSDNVSCQIVRIDSIGKRDSYSLTESLKALPFPPELQPGNLFEGYTIEREIHASSRSQVYQATHNATNQRVAIKTPSFNHAEDPDYIRQFVREEWVGQLIDNANVIKVLTPASPRRFLYTLMEHVEGETLAKWMDRNRAPTLDETRKILEQVARGLRAMHRNDILHQDIKPDNIMIGSDGQVKIIDFGSVRIAGLEELKGASPSLDLLGTREYIAPEYLRGEAPTPRSDLYSLGVLAYQLLTGGKHPYGATAGHSKKLTEANYIPIADFHAEVPDFVDHAIRRAVDVLPSRRQEELSVFIIDITKPSETYVRSKRLEPLLKRNPRLFYVSLLSMSVILNLILAYLLLRK